MPYSESSTTATPISPPPPFSRAEQPPPMRMPKSHYSLPTQGKVPKRLSTFLLLTDTIYFCSADNDGLPSYEEVQNIEKSLNENQR